jgi:uncharacterized protein (TIGR00369 family)
MPSEQGARGKPELAGAEAHYRALESLYDTAPINQLFPSRLEIVAAGVARIHFTMTPAVHHAAHAAHGTSYFKMLDDAAFYAANSLVSDRFLLTTAFNLFFTRPIVAGDVIAEGRWISGKRRVLVAEARLIDAAGEEAARGTGTFMRSHIPLATLPGYGVS